MKKDFLTSALLRRRAAEEAAGVQALLAAGHAARDVAAGAHARRRAGPGEAFWQFRTYQAGDRPQDVDWRQSAKGDRLFVRQREWQTAQTALFRCAGGAGMAWRSDRRLPTKREAALVLSLALATLMSEAGEKIGPLGGERRPMQREAGLESLTAALLDDDAEDLAIAPPARGATIILVGDFLQPLDVIEAQLGAFTKAAAGGLLLQVLDPAELELPYEGRVVFVAPDGGTRHPAAQAAALREDYRARLEVHRQGLLALCRRSGWRYHLHRTDRPARETLAAIARETQA